MQGSLRKRGANSWQLPVSVGWNDKTGKYDYVSKTFRGNKLEAQQELANCCAELPQVVRLLHLAEMGPAAFA